MIVATPYGAAMVTALYVVGGDLTEKYEEATQIVGVLVDGPDEGQSVTAPAYNTRIVPLN